ncbi:MAG: zf-HC2 domain-containing protein [Myxococcales bacterium]|nr:zf-HC2 domain-containing protein [Myxococcales bacterium]HQY64083.1 zf-HC2 domain-containing protein [Polyangiaceae bacterium]
MLLDGQLDAVKTLDVEEHIAVCESCRERVLLERAIRGSVKRAVRESAASAASAGFRERMLGAMSAERDRLDALQHREEEAISVASASLATSVVLAPKEGKPVRRGLFSWRSAVPLAAAAALVFAWGTVSQGPGPRGVAGAARAGFIGNETLSDLLAEHSSPLPPERTNAKDMRSLERYVGVPVRAPAFKSPRARFVGGRLFNVQREHAAMLQYQLGDGRDGASVQRVTVFIYDPQRIRIASDGLSPRAVGTAEVHVGQAGGHSVAVTQREGVGYALATDLDPEASAQLAAFTVDDE